MKTQKRKIGVSGGFFNQIMGNNSSEPVVGEWFTILHYSDRTVGKVVDVFNNGKSAVIEHYYVSADNDKVTYNPSNNKQTIVWRQGKWRTESEVVVFTKSIQEESEKAGFMFVASYLKRFNPELLESVYGNNMLPQNVVDGVTRLKKEYSPISIIFGVRDYYYDLQF